MGYDISYHAISKEEMQKWYFDPLKWTKNGDFERIKKVAEQGGIEEFYAEKYKDGFSHAVNYKQDDVFNKTHGFHIAIAQGIFRKYFYTRGTAISFLAEQNPKFKAYISDWREVLPSEFLDKFSGKIYNEISQNYCCGAYLDASSVARLRRDYDADSEIRKAVDTFYAQNLPVFLDALNFAIELKAGILEATEVVEPNPTDLNSSESFSNLFNCDPKGALIYAQTAAAQINEAIRMSKAGKNSASTHEEKSLFDKIKRLFK
ncbi:hypothetical protein [Campylobacter sp.]|uniref:hypothetical protein n=1 Tax=Campylobacter sp. TaxID=205 RepID=UPI00270EE574|nr:hypothetical protein [Campylobacter sp.]